MYINTEYSFAVKLDKDDECLYSYDTLGDLVLEDTEGILWSLDSNIAKEVEEYYNIDITDYRCEKMNDEI